MNQSPQLRQKNPPISLNAWQSAFELGLGVQLDTKRVFVKRGQIEIGPCLGKKIQDDVVSPTEEETKQNSKLFKKLEQTMLDLQHNKKMRVKEEFMGMLSIGAASDTTGHISPRWGLELLNKYVFEPNFSAFPEMREYYNNKILSEYCAGFAFNVELITYLESRGYPKCPIPIFQNMESYLKEHSSSKECSDFIEAFKTTVYRSPLYIHGVLCDRALDLEVSDFSERLRSIEALYKHKDLVCQSVQEMSKMFSNLMSDNRCAAEIQRQVDRIQQGDYADTRTKDLPEGFDLEDLNHWARKEVLRGVTRILEEEDNLYLTDLDLTILAGAATHLYSQNHRVKESVEDLKPLIFEIKKKQAKCEVDKLKRAYAEKKAQQKAEHSEEKSEEPKLGHEKNSASVEKEQGQPALEESKPTLEQHLLADIETLIVTGQSILSK